MPSTRAQSVIRDGGGTFVLGTSSAGAFDGFVFQASVGDGATRSLTPLPNPSAPAGPYTVASTREL